MNATELIAEWKRILNQYDEGAILPTEAIYAAIARYAENQAEIDAEHIATMGEYNMTLDGVSL